MDNRKRYGNVKLYTDFPINEYSNQVHYSNESNRDTIFDSFCSNTEGVDYFEHIASPNKTTFTFRLEVNYLTASRHNYGVLIENNKRYYFFIRKLIWSSNMVTCTYVCEIDYWQTYCYEIQLKTSFVEREHVNDDTFGLHTIDEGLPISDYIVGKSGNNVQNFDCVPDSDYTFMYCVTVSDNQYIYRDNVMSDDNRAPMVMESNLGIDVQSLTLAFTNMNTASKFINFYVNKNKMNSIVDFYYAPITQYSLIGCYVLSENDLHEIEFILQCSRLKPNIYDLHQDISMIGNINGYVPKNNKCFCYPYNFVNITNNSGKTIQAKFEYSDNNNHTINFRYFFPTQSGASCWGYLKNYCGLEDNYDCSITGLVNVQLPYITDSYAQYLSANINSINANIGNLKRSYYTNLGTNTASVLSNMTSTYNKFFESQDIISDTNAMLNRTNQSIGNVVGYGSNVLQNYVSAKNSKDMIDANIKDMQSKGDILHGSFAPSMCLTKNMFGFRCQVLQVRYEYIKMIDNYFSMYGYKVNELKVPQYDSRSSWNYVKTNGLNIIGNIPQIALDAIKDMFDNGTTIWHNIHNMYNYNQNNS